MYSQYVIFYLVYQSGHVIFAFGDLPPFLKLFKSLPYFSRFAILHDLCSLINSIAYFLFESFTYSTGIFFPVQMSAWKWWRISSSSMSQGCFSPNQYVFSSQPQDLSESIPKCLAVSGALAGIQIKLLNLDRSAKGTLLSALFHLSANIKWMLNVGRDLLADGEFEI